MESIRLNIETFDDSIKQSINNMNFIYNQEFPNNNEYVIDKSLSSQLFNSVLKMTYNEKLSALSKVFNETDIMRELLKYELLYYEHNDHIETKKDFIEFVIATLHRYQLYTNGDLLESYEWSLYMENDKCIIKHDCPILLNTIQLQHFDDREIETFLLNITNYVNRATNKFKLSYRIIEDRDHEICWVILKITEKID